MKNYLNNKYGRSYERKMAGSVQSSIGGEPTVPTPDASKLGLSKDETFGNVTNSFRVTHRPLKTSEWQNRMKLKLPINHHQKPEEQKVPLRRQ